jgi:CBS domain-containing protein
MNVGDVCSRRAVCVSSSSNLAEVAALMNAEHVGAIIVTTAGPVHPRVVGIITDRDIVRAQLENVADLSRLSAHDTMTARPLMLESHEPIDGAIAHLRARGVRRAPVVGPNDEPLGLVSVDDLLAHVAETLVGIARIITRQVSRERT